MKRIYALFVIILALIVAFGVYFAFPAQNATQDKTTDHNVDMCSNTETHDHAFFLIVVNGVAKNFSSDTYMERIPGAHLHDNVGYVVHKHRFGATWGKFLMSLDFNLQISNAKFFINNQSVSNISDVEIKDDDRVLLAFNSTDQIQDMLVSLNSFKHDETAGDSC